MKTAIACLFLVSMTLALNSGLKPSIDDSGLTFAELEQVNQLTQTKWGSIFLTMAELQVQAGPITQLVQTLDDLIKELQGSKQQEQQRYAEKQGAHEAIVSSLTAKINAAKADINANKNKIQNVLQPRKKQAEHEIDVDNHLIEQKKKEIVNANDARKKAHEAFEVRVSQHNDAIKAVDEALGLVNSLLGGKATLLEVRKASASVRRLESHMRELNAVEMPLIAALITMVESQNFANADSVRKVAALLADFRGRLVKSLELEKSNEAAAVENHKKLIVTLNTDIVNAQNNIKANTQVISETVRAIDDCNNHIMIKTAEQMDLVSHLDAENENWRKETETHNATIEEIHKELDVIGQCRALFANHKFGDYVKKRIHQN